LLDVPGIRARQGRARDAHRVDEADVLNEVEQAEPGAKGVCSLVSAAGRCALSPAEAIREDLSLYGRSTANSFPHALHLYQSCASSYARILVSQMSNSLRHCGHRLG
jgi:hypothetical protein